MTDGILNRKGATSPKDVPAEVLKLLEEGRIETVNLGESLAVDNLKLLKNIVMDSGLTLDVSAVPEGLKLMNCYRAIAALLAVNEDALKIFSTHLSDIARCWACLASGMTEATIERRLEILRPFADDPHMGVREMAWMAMRHDIAADVEKSVALLSGWTLDESPYIRRCASEATRPRGVWCAHIAELKEFPGKGLKILDPLKSDKHKYVQDSVANWLNDASKSKPEWVIEVTERWLKESPTKETARICKRALRTINKQ